jgi:hypothetical protein
VPREGGGAEFPPRPIGRVSRRRPIVEAALAISAGGLVLVGLLERPPGPGAASSLSVPASPRTAVSGTAVPAPGTFRPARPSPGPAELIRLDGRPDGRHLFVHGEVFSLRVEPVIVSIRDPDGRTLEIRTLDMPGGSTAFRIGSVNRFEVRFDRPDPEVTRLVAVQASGYDAAGDRILSEQIRVDNAEG